MATYPGGVYAPASKSNGQVIQPSFFNDPEAEITAVEDALKNGIPHAVTISTGGLTVSTGSVNVGGPTSLATLQVTGASTFAGPVTFSSGVTFNGALTFASPMTFSSGAVISTGVVRQNSLPAFNVFHSSLVAVASGSTVAVAFDSQEFVRGSIEHSTGVNSSRVAFQSTGLYFVSYHARMQTGGTPEVRCYLRLNDSTQHYLQSFFLTGATREHSFSAGGTIRVASTGDYLSFVAVSSAANSTWGSTAGSAAVRLMGHFLG
jgi:hypothetical protein